MLGISENMSGINFLSLNEKKSNPWTPQVMSRLINPPGILDTNSLITKKTLSENTIDKPLRNLYEGTSNLRFGLDIEDNLFQQSSKNRIPILPTFPT